VRIAAKNLGIRYVVYHAEHSPLSGPLATAHILVSGRDGRLTALATPPTVACSFGRFVKLRRFQEETTMKWTTPRIVEIAVGLEINAYACAELN
jgi:coenzyme PQQ precursor peptide PqqA